MVSEWWFWEDFGRNTLIVVGALSVTFGLYQLCIRIASHYVVLMAMVKYPNEKVVYRLPYTIWGALLWIGVGLWVFWYFRGY